jgi:hypothetical protein
VAASNFNGVIEHHICFQGVIPDQSVHSLIESNQTKNLSYILHEWPENIGIPNGMNRIIPKLECDWLMKMDDDCVILKNNFFVHMEAITELIPNCVFSPYPVGLIKYTGGPPGFDHKVLFSQKTDTFYCFRMVKHVGGLARIAPWHLVKDWTFDPNVGQKGKGDDDGPHSEKCLQQGINMYYLENALIVEHIESSLGQDARYGTSFKGFTEDFKYAYIPQWLLRAARTGKKILLGKK